MFDFTKDVDDSGNYSGESSNLGESAEVRHKAEGAWPGMLGDTLSSGFTEKRYYQSQVTGYTKKVGLPG